MEKDYDILSRNLTEKEMWSSFAWIIDCLFRHRIETVAVMFGFGWGDYEYETIQLSDLRPRVEKAEAQELGSLSTDDLYIKVEGVVQVQFCHHADIHLLYIQKEHPLTNELKIYLTDIIGLHK